VEEHIERDPKMVMNKLVLSTTELDDLGYPAVVERGEGTPEHGEDYCEMCGICLACAGDETGTMICQGSGGSMNNHIWVQYVDTDGKVQPSLWK
jgi:hypothetical protein